MSGDVVSLADGTYSEIVNFAGKAVVVRSTSGSPQACVFEGQNTVNRIYFISGEPADAVLEGITIQNCVSMVGPGQAAYGGAVVIQGSSPTIRNCIFKNNAVIAGSMDFPFTQLDGLGGAVYASGSMSTLYNCSFINNSANGGNALDSLFVGRGGGGAVGGDFASLTFVGCAFTGNTSFGGMDSVNPPLSRGGAVFIDFGSAIFEGCTFTKNSSGKGGAAFVRTGLLSAANSLFVMNNASEDGGAIGVEGADLAILNSTFSANHANMSGGAAYVSGSGFHTIVNSIMYGDTAPVSTEFAGAPDSTTTISYSVVQSAYSGVTWTVANAVDGGANLDGNPGFIRPPGTQSPEDLGDLRLISTSNCIDSGNNAEVPSTLTTDLDGEARIFMGVVDRGAYEFHVSPLQLINELKDSIDVLVAGGATLPAQGRGLKATLNVALSALNRNLPEVAVLALNVFKLEVNVLVLVRRLTRAQGDALIADANEIIDLIN